MRRSAPSVRFVIPRSFPHNPMNAFKSSSVSRSRHSGKSPSDRPACSIFFFVSANTDAVLQAIPPLENGEALVTREDVVVLGATVRWNGQP